MAQEFCEVENTDPAVRAAWLDKHGFKPDAQGTFRVDGFEGKVPLEHDQLIENIRTNVSRGWYEPLDAKAYDERTFVMVCGGPSLADHLDEIRAKASKPDKYLVVTSNMTAGYLLEHGIEAHVHFILDPQAKKRHDVVIGKTCARTEYWLNAACDPAVFQALRDQNIKPFVFLADFDCGGKAIEAVQQAAQPGRGFMAIQGGSMAGLRAINLADARGFRSMEYYGFDATVQVKDGRVRNYAYEKKRGETVIEIDCDRCDAKFDTTLIFQSQVNEFIYWREAMRWMDIRVIGGGLIAHYQQHLEEADRAQFHNPARYTGQYKAMQLELHEKGNYGVTGQMYGPMIFHAIAQLAKRLGAVSVLDYGSSTGNTLKAVRDGFWLPPTVTDACYDPFVAEFAKEPEPADFLICTDVLEHVEPECTRSVLDHIASLTKRLAFFSISLVPAQKVLSDGRNAHINLPGEEFWLKELKRRFILSEVSVQPDRTMLVVAQSVDEVRNEIRKRNGLDARKLS